MFAIRTKARICGTCEHWIDDGTCERHMSRSKAGIGHIVTIILEPRASDSTCPSWTPKSKRTWSLFARAKSRRQT